MNDRAVSLFEKYGIDASKVRKGRGSMIVQLEDKQVMLTQYSGPLQHLQMEYDILQSLIKTYNRPLDLIYKTLEDELFCVDYEGKKYIVKQYIEGREADVLCIDDLQKAAEGIAQLHMGLRACHFDGKEALCQTPDDIMEDFDRKSKEMLRTRNYIRKLPRKDEFALAYLQYFDQFYNQTKEIPKLLDDNCLIKLKMQQTDQQMLIHGDCNHHNVLLRSDGVVIVNFEHMGPHLQVKDLYLYMRKILEKNDWSYEVGYGLLNAYQQILPLTREERIYLYSRLYYPEKFWKITNAYFNQRKALPAKRQMEKLIGVLQKEEKRQQFLSKWMETCR